MKVRWTDGSIRFRISPGELSLIEAGVPVTVCLPIPGTEWQATIAPSDAETSIRGEAGSIMLTLSPEDRCRLADPTTEGVYFRHKPDGLRYFIEKDFPCVHVRPEESEEPAAETFAPPPGFAERHQRGNLC